MLYGTEKWDPCLILLQITAFQFYYYAVLSLLLVLLVGPYAPDVSLYHVFDWRWLGFKSFQGGMVTLAFLLAAVFNAAFLRLVIKRAKKCMDFTATMYAIHLGIVWANYGTPSSFAWWLCQAGFLAVSVTLGEWLCMQKELQDIPLASLSGKSTSLQSELARQIPIVTVQP